MKKVAVVLSGCGYLDGSEIHESVLTLLAIERHGGRYQCFAPELAQRRVMNHLTNEEMPDETRYVMVEAARIARGNIQNITTAKSEDFDALIFPGGFGAAANLSDFAVSAEHSQIHPDVEEFAKAVYALKKPMGFICIAPNLISGICGAGISCTIGNDKATAATLEAMGAKHSDCEARNIVVDTEHQIYSTPAYMLGQSILEVAEGIDKLVAEMLA